MKKPRKPAEPKEPQEFRDFKFCFEIYDDIIRPFDKDWLAGKIKDHTRGFLSSYKDEVLEYVLNNKEKISFRADLDPYSDDCVEVEFSITITAESKIIPNSNYKDQLRSYKQKKKAYPARLEAYKKKLAEWKEWDKKEKSKKKEKEIEAAKKLLKEAGEL